MLKISNNVSIPDGEISLSAIRAQGSGGQNVNKVSSAIHLQFDINNSSLPDFYKNRLLALRDKRITNEGVLVIKAQKFRTQNRNKAEALMRLQELIKAAVHIPKKRSPTLRRGVAMLVQLSIEHGGEVGSIGEDLRRRYPSASVVQVTDSEE